MNAKRQVRGRYAPSPTGDLHLGNIAAAIVAWLSIRRQNGIFVLRIDDLDPPRTVAGSTTRMIEDLKWLGFDWDEGPEIGGPFAPYLQSQRSSHYEEALMQLATGGRLFPSTISRKELADLASAPHGQPSNFPPSHRPASLERNWYDEFEGSVDDRLAALRFRVDLADGKFEDIFAGPQNVNLPDGVGDFVVKRKDGLYAYQLACAVDDTLMEFDEVIRGSDLIHSTFAQMQIMDALGATPPRYGHIPIIAREDGKKMSKREGALTVGELRDSGASPENVVGLLAGKMNLRPTTEPVRLLDLVDGFDAKRVGRAPVVLTDSDLRQL